VDVETVERRGRTIEIADRYFAPDEVRDLHALPDDRRRERFFEYWTLKESYIKARGMGLAIPLEQFSFELEPGRPIRIDIDSRLADDPRLWQFERMSWPPSHLVALAIRRGSAADFVVRTRACVPLARTRTA